MKTHPKLGGQKLTLVLLLLCFGLVKVVADKIRVGDGKVLRFANTPESD